MLQLSWQRGSVLCAQVKDLGRGLSALQQAESAAFTALVERALLPATSYFTFLDPQVLLTYSLSAFGFHRIRPAAGGSQRVWVRVKGRSSEGCRSLLRPIRHRRIQFGSAASALSPHCQGSVSSTGRVSASTRVPHTPPGCRCHSTTSPRGGGAVWWLHNTRGCTRTRCASDSERQRDAEVRMWCQRRG